MDELEKGIFVIPSASDSLEGIFYLSYLATHKNQTNFVNVTPSSLLWGNPYSLVDYESTGDYYKDCMATQNISESNIVFSLKMNAIRITHYSLKTRPNNEIHYTKNWRFEGSNNGETWTILDSHQNSEVLSGLNITKVFKVQKSGLYSYFRLIQIGKNSNGNYYLVVNNVDIFGKLCSKEDHFCFIPNIFTNHLNYITFKGMKIFVVILFLNDQKT